MKRIKLNTRCIRLSSVMQSGVSLSVCGHYQMSAEKLQKQTTVTCKVLWEANVKYQSETKVVIEGRKRGGFPTHWFLTFSLVWWEFHSLGLRTNGQRFFTHQWRSKVGVSPCARIPKGFPSSFATQGSSGSGSSIAMSPRALHALLTLALEAWLSG